MMKRWHTIIVPQYQSSFMFQRFAHHENMKTAVHFHRIKDVFFEIRHILEMMTKKNRKGRILNG
ncbi:MAG: hypothetical protein AAF603_00905 [Pseudomonadota bacterium]